MKTGKCRSNMGLEGSAQQHRVARCWVPSALRASAPPQPRRWAAEKGK